MNVLIQLPDSAVNTIDEIVAQNKAQVRPNLATEQEKAEALRITHAHGLAAANEYLREVAKERQRNGPPRNRTAVVRMIVLQWLGQYKLPSMPPAPKEKPTPPVVAPWGVKPPRATRRKASTQAGV